MKLLLTSSGITNQSIANALFELTGKKPEDTTVVFIPTAATIETGDKDWFITDLMNLKKYNIYTKLRGVKLSFNNLARSVCSS